MNSNSVRNHSPKSFAPRNSRAPHDDVAPAPKFVNDVSKRADSADVRGSRRSGLALIEPSTQGATSSPSTQSNRKLSNEMKRAAFTFDSMSRQRHVQPGGSVIEPGKPRTESQVAQRLFAAVMKESVASAGSSRITPAIVANLRANANELPSLGREVMRRGMVDKDAHAELFTGADRAARALRCLAGDPADADLHRCLLPAILQLPNASAVSTQPLHAGVAVNLAQQMYNGLAVGGFAVRATPVAHAKASVAAAVAAELLSQEMGEAVVTEFTKLVPVGAGMNAEAPVTRASKHIPRAADPDTMPPLKSVTPFARFDASAHRAAMARNAPAEPNRGGAAALPDNQSPAVQKSRRARLHESIHRVAAHLHLGRHRVETPAPLRAQAGPRSASEAASLLEIQRLRLVGDVGDLVAQPVFGSDEIKPDEESLIATPSQAYARLAALPR